MLVANCLLVGLRQLLMGRMYILTDLIPVRHKEINDLRRRSYCIYIGHRCVDDGVVFIYKIFITVIKFNDNFIILI